MMHQRGYKRLSISRRRKLISVAHSLCWTDQ